MCSLAVVQLERAEQWYERKPVEEMENEHYRILWDFNIQIDQKKQY